MVPKIGDKVVVTSSTSEYAGMRAEVKHHSDTQHKSWLFFGVLNLYAWFDDADLTVVFEDNMSRKESKMKFKVGDVQLRYKAGFCNSLQLEVDGKWYTMTSDLQKAPFMVKFAYKGEL